MAAALGMTAAAPVHATEQLLAQVLLQLIVMIVAARIGNGLFRRMGQPGAVGEIVAGLLLSASLFGHLLPGASAALFTAGSGPIIKILAQVGLILLMVQIGSGFIFGRLGDAWLRRLTLRWRCPRSRCPSRSASGSAGGARHRCNQG